MGTIGKLGVRLMAESPRSDVRMRGFRERTEVEQLIAWIDQRITPLGSESIPLTDAAQRVLAEDVISECAVPAFDRAAMDGYAVRGDDTFGADRYAPLHFDVIGEALRGRPFASGVGKSQTVRIMTGSPLPEGADAISPAEVAEEVII